MEVLNHIINKFSLFDKNKKIKIKSLFWLFLRFCYLFATIALFLSATYFLGKYFSVTKSINIPSYVFPIIWGVIGAFLSPLYYYWFIRNIFVYRLVYKYENATNQNDQIIMDKYKKRILFYFSNF